MKLKDKVALITGGGQGIGKAIALGYAKEGANISVTDINLDNAKKVAEEINGSGRKAIAIKADVMIESEVDNMVSETVKELGGLNILVNNAGLGFPHAADGMKEEEWDKMVGVNLKGVYLCTKRSIRELTKAAPGSKIVNLASVEAIVGSAFLTAYCASKGGVGGYTRALAVELGPRKINVNCLCPHFTETAMTDMVFKNPAMKKMLVERTPMGRLGQVEDMVGPAVFLASPDSDYVTGHSLVIDGGYTIS